MKFLIGFKTINFTIKMKFNSNFCFTWRENQTNAQKQENKGLINGKNHYIRIHLYVIFLCVIHDQCPCDIYTIEFKSTIKNCYHSINNCLKRVYFTTDKSKTITLIMSLILCI
jgi:hypothetical protein